MKHDELVKALRAEAGFQRNRFSREMLAGELEQAANTIEALQVELALYRPTGIPCCKCGGEVVEFSAPNGIWNLVIRENGKETDKEYLCLDCWYKALREKLAELQPFREAAAEYGIDAQTMLTLARSQIKTARDNVRQTEENERLKAILQLAVNDIYSGNANDCDTCVHVCDYDDDCAGTCSGNCYKWRGGLLPQPPEKGE